MLADRSPFRVVLVAGWLAAGVLVSAVAASAGPSGPTTVKITSPLGRMGTSGKVRIVAQIQLAPETTLKPVRFYVDKMLLGVDDDGPPYAVEWVDENPFERREIAVEVDDRLGQVSRDTIELKPLRDRRGDRHQPACCSKRACTTRPGGSSAAWSRSSFTVTEDGVNRRSTSSTRRPCRPTFALLIDSSQSMSRRIDFVRDAARRLAAACGRRTACIVAPFSSELGALTGPTDDRTTIIEARDRRDAAGRRHGHSRQPRRGRRTLLSHARAAAPSS